MNVKCHVVKIGDRWRLVVPQAILVSSRERGVYERATYPEIIRLMDFYVDRARVRIFRYGSSGFTAEA